MQGVPSKVCLLVQGAATVCHTGAHQGPWALLLPKDKLHRPHVLLKKSLWPSAGDPVCVCVCVQARTNAGIHMQVRERRVQGEELESTIEA